MSGITNGSEMEGVSQPLTANAIRYTWRQLAQRVGLPQQSGSPSIDGFEEVGVKVHYGRPAHGMVEPPAIIVISTGLATWNDVLQAAPQSLTWLSAKQLLPPGADSPLGGQVPVLFWGDAGQPTGRSPVERQKDGVVVFDIDIIATAFFMLSRWEETVIPTRDDHGRFPAKASVAYRQGFLDRPIVDEYALILRAWLQVLCPNWEPRRREFHVKLSHDIDHVQRFPSWQKGARTVAGDLIKRRDIALAKGNWIDTLARLANPRWDRYYRGLHELAEISRGYGLGDDIFYFMAGEPGPLDAGYNVGSPLLSKCIKSLIEEGFEVGLHPSYRAFDEPSRLAEEKARLDAVLGYSDYGARQHYLRFRVPDSWRHMEQAGLTYDATMTYAEQPGFRCGTCRPFRPFDIEADRQLSLIERPLIAMERTFQNYQVIPPSQTVDEILQLAKTCQRVEGEFSLLWHNGAKEEPWAPSSRTYDQITKALASLEHKTRERET